MLLLVEIGIERGVVVHLHLPVELQLVAAGAKVLEQLDKRAGNTEYLSQFEALHRTLRQGADEGAARAVLGWLDTRTEQIEKCC